MNYIKIETMTAFVSVDEFTGYEGVLGMKMGDSWIPLVAADPDRLRSMYPMAENIKANTGKDYRVLQFSVRTDITEEVREKYGYKES